MSEISQIREALGRVAQSSRPDTCQLSQRACIALLAELDRLYTQVRAANTLTSELRSESRAWASGSKTRMDSALDRYQFAIDPRIMRALEKAGIVVQSQVHDEFTLAVDLETLPLGPMQRKSLQQRPTLEDLKAEDRSTDLHKEVAERLLGGPIDFGRSAVSDVAGQVYRTSPTADFKPKESPKDALTRLVVDQYLDRAANVFLAQKDVIGAIRYIRNTAQIGLKEAKEYVDILRGL